MGLAAGLGETLAEVAGWLDGTLAVVAGCLDGMLEVVAGQLLNKVSGFCWYCLQCQLCGICSGQHWVVCWAWMEGGPRRTEEAEASAWGLLNSCLLFPSPDFDPMVSLLSAWKGP